MNARIAILHYHLRPGGVTRVIETTLRLWTEQEVQCVTLCGEGPRGEWPGLVRVVPELGYSFDIGPVSDWADRILAEARQALGGDPDLLWIHNHSLGKNPRLAAAVPYWAAQGRRLLLQIHDFAEDGRPELYAELNRFRPRPGDWLYPDAPGVHYALLNRRDESVLWAAGADPARLHWLPNPVALRASLPDTRAESDYRLYPVRPIRRKNIGELLLQAACRKQHRFGITLAPTQVGEADAAYPRFQALARDLNLKVDFEVGLKPGAVYEDLLAQAGGIITTSIAEGFGLVFLEAWLAGRNLEGRDIPEITKDFKDAGVRLDSLYPDWPVASDRFDVRAFRVRFRRAFENSRIQFGREFDGAEEAAAWNLQENGGQFDFGGLDEEAQREMIRSAQVDPDFPRPSGASDGTPDERAHNRAVILDQFGPEAYRRRLDQTLAACLGSSGGGVGPALRGKAILDFFLDPSRFRMLRT